jgi:hypothetical protein
MHSAFIRNESHSAAAASFHDESAGWVLECLFEDNVSSSSGRALTFWIPRPNLVDRCTLVGNVAGHYQFVMENTIVAFSIQGPGVASHEGYAELACCDIFGNAGGDWVGTIADQYGVNGNICRDPLFCDPENGDFELDAESPCAPFSSPNPECDLVGAWPVGCVATTVTPTTWGLIKALYGEAHLSDGPPAAPDADR